MTSTGDIRRFPDGSLRPMIRELSAAEPDRMVTIRLKSIEAGFFAREYVGRFLIDAVNLARSLGAEAEVSEDRAWLNSRYRVTMEGTVRQVLPAVSALSSLAGG